MGFAGPVILASEQNCWKMNRVSTELNSRDPSPRVMLSGCISIVADIVESGLKPIHDTESNHGLKAVVMQKIVLIRALAREATI